MTLATLTEALGGKADAKSLADKYRCELMFWWIARSAPFNRRQRAMAVNMIASRRRCLAVLDR